LYKKVPFCQKPKDNKTAGTPVATDKPGFLIKAVGDADDAGFPGLEYIPAKINQGQAVFMVCSKQGIILLGRCDAVIGFLQ
jgi:hypothetical protein